MAEWVENLLAVQDLDLRMTRFREQIDSAPAEKDRLNHLLVDAETAEKQARKDLQEAEKRLKSLEMEVESVQTRMRDFQAKSTMIKNNDEYRAAMHQIDNCSRQIEELEDRELAIMEEIDSLRTTVGQRRKEREAAAARVAAMSQDLDTRVANATKGYEQLSERRESAIAAVDNDVAQRYDRVRSSSLRRGNDGRVLVPLRDSSCGRCHMNVTAQVRTDARKGLCVSCENCGALLYWEP